MNLSELVELLDGDAGLQIRDMDKAISQGDYTDISQEVQDILKGLFDIKKGDATKGRAEIRQQVDLAPIPNTRSTD
jgi:predicted component of type VI protein secretion system